MQHCNQPIFSNDKFCGHCGDSVANDSLKVKGIEQVSPEVMQQLRSVYPNARVVSGKVVSTYYYKRKFVNNNNNLIYGYWWIELQDENGNIEATSIEAEDEFFNSIQKGDVLTVLYPTSFTLAYRIADSDARKVVKHNNTAPCVINHLPTQQRSIRGRELDPPARKTASIWFWLWVTISSVAYFWLNLGPVEYAIGAGAIAALICYLIERKRNQTKYEAGQHRFTVLKQSMQQLLSISREDLGYHLQQRPNQASDVICFSCNSRIPQAVNYCVSCGVDQQAQRDNLSSIVEQETELMREYGLKYKEAYIHKNVMSADQHGTVAIRCFMAKVLSKEVESDVSDVSITTTSTTTTDHYYGSRYSHSTSSTSTRTDRNRDTGISGEVEMLSEDGSRITWQFSEEVLGDLDVGDWVYFSYSDVNIGDTKQYNRECGINITKNREYSPRTFAGFGGFTGQGLWWVLAIFFAAWTYSDFRAPLFPLLDLTYNSVTAHLYQQRWFVKCLPLLIFGVFNLYLMLHSYIYSRRNHQRQQQVLAAMHDKVAAVRTNLKAIQAKINAWG
ncbi:hypothetical protein HR45_01180 [Shewanella mangrovi]|uniref:Uncharacterized protein n=1 Tax=Shewanella mangrovi TaxID=1515746 RepID=A0A094JLV7_9GAMM|nr:hypothetical protein [Shewanella mangrovi]KFZ39039.1 hypothetical protein HR45_01180 [Shewanella mangrovi]